MTYRKGHASCHANKLPFIFSLLLSEDRKDCFAACDHEGASVNDQTLLVG